MITKTETKTLNHNIATVGSSYSNFWRR